MIHEEQTRGGLYANNTLNVFSEGNDERERRRAMQ